MTESGQSASWNPPADLDELLPEHSILSLDEYLAMQEALGDRIRFEIVHRLRHTDTEQLAPLAVAMDMNEARLEEYLRELGDVGLVERRQRTERGSDQIQTYYCATSLAATILDEGLMELIRGEWNLEDEYSTEEMTGDVGEADDR